MSGVNVFLLAISIATFVYVGVALIHPEWF